MIWNLFGKTAFLCLTMLFIATATTVEAANCASQPNPGGTINDTDFRCNTLIVIDDTLALVQSEIDQLPQPVGAEFDVLSIRKADLEQIRFDVSEATNQQELDAAVDDEPALCEVSPTTPATLTEFCPS